MENQGPPEMGSGVRLRRSTHRLDVAPCTKQVSRGAPYTEGARPPQSVLPFLPDNRQQVGDPAQYPFSAIGKLTMRFPNGRRYCGTGTLIRPSHVLTCAHNLFSAADGGFATDVLFTPARKSGAYPDSATSGQHLFVPVSFRDSGPVNLNGGLGERIDHEQFADGYGLVMLSARTHHGYVGMLAAPDASLRERTVTVVGYPGDKIEGTMWGASDPLTGQSDRFLYYQRTSWVGESGSPVLACFEQGGRIDVPCIVGIHVASDRDGESNFAIRITESILDTVVAWINES